MLSRIASIATLVAAIASPACSQQAPRSPGTVVLAIIGDVTVPVPVVAPAVTHVADVTDQMFLRLAFLKSGFQTIGDQALAPMLARSWRRIDGRTLRFELDPRARWHDGTPVTSRDVVFTWQLMNNPQVGTDRAVLEPIESIAVDGPGAFTVRFRRAFQEQLYLVAFNIQPLPAHLLSGVPAESIATSEFARQPVGNGPYRFGRRVAGQFVELTADPSFFLGRPGIGRLVFRVVGDPVARLNMLLSGEIDVMDMLPATAMPQVRAHRELRVATFMSNLLMYARFNSRSPADTSKQHPILADRAVREALVASLDRTAMARSAFGPNTLVPDAAQSVTWSWIAPVAARKAASGVAQTRAALAAAGWRDSDGDGIVDRNGLPLRLGLLYPNTSGLRNAVALQMQAMWKAAGIDAQLDRVDPAVYSQRRRAGAFDVEITAVNQDASPMSLAQSWTCASAAEALSSNNARWCDAEFDRLLAAAGTSRNPAADYRAALARMTHEAPAVFIAAPYNNMAIHSRLENIQVWPIKQWTSLWQWRVRRGAELPRDR